MSHSRSKGVTYPVAWLGTDWPGVPARCTGAMHRRAGNRRPA